VNAQNNFWQLSWIRFQLEQNPQSYNPKKIDWDPLARNELEKTSDNFILDLETNNSFLYAPELDDYLHRKLLEIYPQPFISSRYSIIRNISVVKSSAPDVQVLNNGQILITTGMLCLIETEDELTALLTQQVARFVLDMNYITYKKYRNNDLASFFLGTTATIVTNTALNKKNENYERNYFLGQTAGLATILISSSIFNAMKKRYNLDFEMKIDSLTIEYLSLKKIKTETLGNLMVKIREYANNHPEYSDVSFLTQTESYPKRLKRLEHKPDNDQIIQKDAQYDRNISEALTKNASLLISRFDYNEANQYLDRVIDAEYAIEDTYLLKANILRNTQITKEANDSILHLLQLAEKSSTAYSQEIDVERGLLYYRMNNRPLALEAFMNAKKKLESLYNSTDSELVWVNKMIARCKL
jgi:hypothetical protein